MSVEPAPEEHFGPYLVYERLGVGGMATVHRALEQSDDGAPRVIALKRLLPHLAEDASFIKAFVREAKLASLLNHLNIVQIYELGRVGTEYFISMEYIDGKDLRRLLRHARKVTGPPPLYVTIGLMLQLCDALDYAHSRIDEDGRPLGLVHRDISPSNLIVTGGGQLKIIDFGIAKAQSSHLRTQTGRVKGKLAYMAPEAVSGSRDLDARSDIWAAGVILHEMITARPLFASKNEYQTLLKVQKGDILPPSTFNQACPPELDAIVFRALARDPDDRFASAAELRDELLALKRQYALKTDFRELGGWVDWAFGLEPPGGFSGDTSGVMAANTSRIHAKTPRPPRDQELDEAVEVVWGSGNQENEDGPIVLEEVPDVSGKVRARRDTDDERFQQDDIPTPLPSHGTMPSVYGKPDSPLRISEPDPKLFGAEAALAPGATIPGRGSDRMPASGPVHLDAPQLGDRMAAQRAREEHDSDQPPLDAPTVLDRGGGHHGLELEPPHAREPLSPAELFGDDAAQVLGGIADDMESRSTGPSMNAFREEQTTSPQMKASAGPSIPVVRFSKSHSIPPINEVMSGLEPGRIVTTKPGIGPAYNITPAPPRAAPSTSRPPANKPVAIIAPQSSSKKILVFFAVGVLLAGGTATLVAMSMSGGVPVTQDSATSLSSTPPVEPLPSAVEPVVAGIGKVKFELEPPDAEISIEGKAVHTGSPWMTELTAGTHPIEIHRSGYKSWRTSIELSASETATLRVVLEPITTTSDATLTVVTTPPGLDVYIDGTLLGDKTPIKAMMKVGSHKITVKQNGAEVWQQNVNAEASSDYEFHPSFTDAKKRERAQRMTPRPGPVTGSAAPVAPAPTETTPPAIPTTTPTIPSIPTTPTPKPQQLKGMTPPTDATPEADKVSPAPTSGSTAEPTPTDTPAPPKTQQLK